MYGNNRCGRCRYFKGRFKREGIRYEYHNVDRLIDTVLKLQRRVYPKRRHWYRLPVIELKDARVHVGGDYGTFVDLLVGLR